MIVGTMINIYVLNVCVWLIGFIWFGVLMFKLATNITVDFFLFDMFLGDRFTSVMLLLIHSSKPKPDSNQEQPEEKTGSYFKQM